MEKINIAELLKDCPKGMELDCTLYDNCTYEGIEDVGYIDILVKTPSGRIRLTKEGCYIRHDDNAKCVIYPKGKTTWEGFVSPIAFKDGDIVATNSELQVFILQRAQSNTKGYCYIGYDFEFNDFFHAGVWEFDRLATEEEKQKLFDAIKANGYRWNPETKTLEKLIEPKFKEIHFYKDLEDELGELGKAMNGECAFKYFYRSHNDTMIAIKKGNPTIHTYAISALCFSDLLDKGYKIFLHENGKCGELHEGTTELTDKELRKGHNISNIWIGDGFKDFFYR